MPRTFEHPDDQDEIRYTLRLPRAVYDDLRAQAGAEGFTLHAAMLVALHAYLRQGQRRKVRPTPEGRPCPPPAEPP